LNCHAKAQQTPLTIGWESVTCDLHWIDFKNRLEVPTTTNVTSFK
jgi:hypothetical protein